MSAYKVIDEALKTAGKFYIELLQTELEFQQHIASQRLVKGFKTIVSEKGGNLYMEIVNDTEYMWLVNDGNSKVPNVTYEDLKEWNELKGLGFSKSRLHNIKAELIENYYTEGGKLVAPRRTGFIEYGFAIGESLGINKMVEDEILKQINAEVGDGTDKGSKAIQLTIS